MHCEYCDVEVIHYPTNGICVCCGGKLPPKPAHHRAASTIYTSAQPVSIPVKPQIQLIPGINCCPKCRNMSLVYATRGFSWGWAMAGFFLIPVFGIILGFWGSKKLYIQCTNCGHKWTRN